MLVVLGMMLASLTAACQTTPNQGFVQSKNDDQLNRIISQTNQPNSSSSQNSDIPAHVSQTIQSNELNVYVNAKVTVPQTNAYPVVYAEPVVFTQQQADLILNELIGDAPLVSLRAQDAATRLSKEQIINKLGELRLLLQDETVKNDEHQVESINKRIAEFEEKMKTAPETADLPYIERQFARPLIEHSGDIVISEEELAALSEEERKAIELDIAQSQQKPKADCEAIEGACDLGKSGMASIAICKKDNPIYSYIYFINTDQENPINYSSEDSVEISMDDHIDGLDISAEDGYAVALKTLSNMSIAGMELVRMAQVPLGNTQNDQLRYCYKFIFSRPVNDIPTTYALAEGLSTNNDRVSETWNQEYIEIYVDDNGILRFAWDAPTQLAGSINDNVLLKPFDEMLSIFKQQIMNHCVFTDEVGIIERQITIDEITLGMMKIKQQDSHKYIYVPVWDFFGYSTNTYDDTLQFILDENGRKTIDAFGHSFLTINAIDGSIIDRSLGY